MERFKITADQAFDVLAKVSQGTNRKVYAVAEDDARPLRTLRGGHERRRGTINRARCAGCAGEGVGRAGGAPGRPGRRTVFEWTLAGRFLLQRSESPVLEFPDGFMIIAPDAVAGGLVQHYFDSRGVVRRYRITLAGGVWTSLR